MHNSDTSPQNGSGHWRRTRLNALLVGNQGLTFRDTDASFAAALLPAAALFFPAGPLRGCRHQGRVPGYRLNCRHLLRPIFVTAAILAAPFFAGAASKSPSVPRRRHQIFRRDIRREPHLIVAAGVRHYGRADS